MRRLLAIAILCTLLATSCGGDDRSAVDGSGSSASVPESASGASTTPPDETVGTNRTAEGPCLNSMLSPGPYPWAPGAGHDAVVSDGQLWVERAELPACVRDGDRATAVTVARLDPVTGVLTEMRDLDLPLTAVATGPSGVWAAAATAPITVVRIHPFTGEVLTTVTLPGSEPSPGAGSPTLLVGSRGVLLDNPGR